MTPTYAKQPQGNPETSLNLIQLAVQIEGRNYHERDLEARDMLSLANPSPRFLSVGGVDGDGVARGLKMSADGKLEVNASIGAVSMDASVGSTDGTSFDAGIRVSSSWRSESLLWGVDADGAEKAGHVEEETVNGILFRPLMVGGCDDTGVAKVLRVTPVGEIAVAQSNQYLEPEVLVNSTDILSGNYNGSTVDVRAMGSQSFAVHSRGVVNGAGQCKVVFEWSFDNVNFYSFANVGEDDFVVVDGDADTLVALNYKVPYVRATRQNVGNITSGQVIVEHFANAAR